MLSKSKWLNICLILSSLIVHLEWGDNRQFLGEMELEILAKLATDPMSVLHPFTVLPLIGQLILLVTLFQSKPNKTLSLAGMILLGILLYFIFIIGLISLSLKIILFATPYVVVSFMTVIHRHQK